MELKNAPAFSPRISVVLCTCDGGRYLKEQLESIAQQTRPPAELVACDDNSSDDTISVLTDFAARAPFPVHVVKNSQRLGSTRNFDQAIGLASGEFIALCDQDDRWAPEKLDRLSQFMVRNASIGGVFSDADLIDGQSRPIGTTLFAKHKFSLRKQRQFLDDPVATLLKHSVITGSTLMFRASLRSCGLPIPESWVHDGWLAWMLSIHSRIALTDETLTAYRVHAGQQIGVGAPGGVRGSELKNERRREHYARVALQFDDLLRRLIADGRREQDEVVVKIREKIAFLRRQSTLSPSVAVRVLQMVRLLPRYLHYARGIGSLRNDLLIDRGIS